MSIHEKLREMLDDWHESATNFEGDQDWPHRIAALLPEPEAPSDAAGPGSEYERGWQAGYAEAGCQLSGETTYIPSDAVESVEEHVGGWILVDADGCAREEETGEIIDADDIGGAMLADIERLPEGKWWVVFRSQRTPTPAPLPSGSAETTGEAVRSWKEWHAEIATLLGLRYVERSTTVDAIRKLVERTPEPAPLFRPLPADLLDIHGLPLIGYHPDWACEDFNPAGICECSYAEIWSRTNWNPEQDCWDTIEGDAARPALYVEATALPLPGAPALIDAGKGARNVFPLGQDGVTISNTESVDWKGTYRVWLEPIEKEGE